MAQNNNQKGNDWESNFKAHGREEGISSKLPYLLFASDEAIMLKQGDLMATLRLDGINSMTAADSDIDAIKRTIASIVTVAGPGFAFYVHRISMSQDLRLEPNMSDDFAGHIDRRWQSHIEGLGQKKQRLFLTVVKRPSVLNRLPLIKKVAATNYSSERSENLRLLNEIVDLCFDALGDAQPERMKRGNGEWLGFLGAISSGVYQPIGEAEGFNSVSSSVANIRTTFLDDKIVLTDPVDGSERFGAIFGIKNYTSETDAAIFDALNLPADVVLTNSIAVVPTNIMMEKIDRTIRQMNAADSAAISLKNQLEQAADDTESGRIAFGNHHASIAVYADSYQQLEKIVARVKRIGQDAGLTLVRESMAAGATYFAQHPGNFRYRARTAPISTLNFAGMAALHGTVEGRKGRENPWGESVTVLPSVGSSGFRLNFHEAGSPQSEPTAGHTLVLGTMGSGKTLTTAFLAAQAKRIEGMRLFFFDKDQGLEMAVRALGGSYRKIRAGEPTGLNPLATETDTRGQSWLSDWLIPVLSRNDNLTGEQARYLQNAIRENASADEELQNFDGFQQLFQSLDDGDEMASRVAEWKRGGRFGWVFAETEKHDQIRIDQDIMGFDMTEILDMERERMAVLSYVFRLIERKLEDRKPTILVLDEAWNLLNDPYFAARLENWLVTLRKMNCVVIMMTQLPSQLESSKVGKTITETVTTQILFPNHKAVAEDYAYLRCTEKEAQLLIQPTLGMRTALVRSAGESVFVNTDLSALGSLLKILGGGATGAAFAGDDWQTNPDFWRKAL